MNPIAILSSEKPKRRKSLSDAISILRNEFSRMKDELRTTHSENNRLRSELARWRLRCRPRQEMDLAGLRRRVAFYCHPDRGGDADLMSRLNTLFDLLAVMWRPQGLCFQNARKG